MALRTVWSFLNFGRLSRYLAEAFTELALWETVIQTATPTNGGTTVIGDTSANRHVVCTPGGTIAAHTFTMPTNANSRIGQLVTISTSAEITAVTISGSGLTIVEDITGLAAGASITLQKVAASTWRRFG